MANLKLLAALATGFLSSFVVVAPTATVNSIGKRAEISDVLHPPSSPPGYILYTNKPQSAHGYASMNGGTTGGAGGTTTTVSSYAEFTSAVEGDDAKVVIVSGNIKKEADQVKVGSNTSIVGKDSSAVLEGFGMYVLIFPAREMRKE